MDFSLEHAQKNVLLAPYTTYKIGGPAEYFVTATSKEELVGWILMARKLKLPYFIMGSGANILIRDGGIAGLVILNRYNTITVEGTTLKAGSGATIADAIALAGSSGLSGLEHYAGIPSTVGGALWQNLHFLSPDRERTIYIAEVLERAEILTNDGQVHTVNTGFFQFGYDESILRDEPDIIALSATFSLTPERTEIIQERITANLEWRKARQPQVEEYPSCGSVFKKIEGVGAGRLIEQAGMKGYRLGGVQVSSLHANFLINVDGATASDVLALISLIQKTVEEKTGYHLQPEIHVVGRD